MITHASNYIAISKKTRNQVTVLFQFSHNAFIQLTIKILPGRDEINCHETQIRVTVQETDNHHY